MNNKEKREIVFNSYGGHCAFCGDELQKGWHVSPILNPKMAIAESGQLVQENIGVENFLPACRACNLSRIQLSYGQELMTIERFRTYLKFSFERMLKDTADYKKAMRYGLIVETGNPIKFYFEKINNQ